MIFDQNLCERQQLATAMLAAAVSHNRMANAYLLTGRNIDDKWLIARQLAAYLNCQKDNKAKAGSCLVAPDWPGRAREICQNCRWISTGEHPQAWLVLSADENKKTGKIPVEKARLIACELAKNSLFTRLVIIPDASEESFHRPSANALLKTIEEPGASCHFFLFASEEKDCLPTVISRCQVIPVLKPGSFCLCFGQADQETAAQMQSGSAFPGTSLPAVLEWSADLLELAQQTGQAQLLLDIVVSKELERLRSKSDTPAVSLYLSRLVELAETSKRQLDHFVQPKFAFESFALGWRKLAEKR